MVFEQSIYKPAQLAARAAALPVVDFPDLPVSEHRGEIAEAIKTHQVVIVAGETGSGKTTQLPKICLQLGRGIAGMIGHTQPRRLAARSVAERIAFELGQKVGKAKGEVVGYQVRFTDEVGPTTLVKLMTDGILLNEIQIDPELRKYDTIIVDEAHERSLNIDFILGYLARLLPRRPDLKLIITSATIDSQKFADHFAELIGAEVPVVEVSGRTYPVEIRYRPLTADLEPVRSESNSKQLILEDQTGDLPTLGYGLGEDIDLEQGLCKAVDELLAEPSPTDSGDILIFLPGERDIREAQSALEEHLARKPRSLQAEVIPLFSRLSSTEQQRIFRPHQARRIILSTNIAETSLTVPGIRYVVDPGLARISRFSNKTKVQRLPIERVSQASANQRSGRAGRLSDGIAIRLYSQNDYLKRDEYTEPEILRTSLASVILQMAALKLGEVADFPFIDAPSSRSVRDGVQLLVEIGALTEKAELTKIGRQLARLPIDPRLGRMLLAADQNGCASEVLVIVAALSIQDIRERPLESQAAADQAHARFADPGSDFITYLNLWRYLNVQARDLSGAQFRRMCHREFFHYLRFREWRDVVGQLRQMCRQLKISAGPVGEPSRRQAAGDPMQAVLEYGRSFNAVDSEQIHRSLLVGLLSNIGNWDEIKRNYAGTRGGRFTIWPGSGLAAAHSTWVMAAELVETSRLFARTVARIKVEWIEEAAAHLLNRNHSEPYWSRAKGAAMIKERLLLYGLTLVADRSVLLGNLGEMVIGEESPHQTTVAQPGTIAAIAQGLMADSKNSGWTSQFLQGGSGVAADPLTAAALANEMFLRHALVEDDWRANHLAFVRHNRELLEEAKELEQRSRQRGLVASEEDRVEFFAERVPSRITSARTFENWWKKQRPQDPELLNYSWNFLVRNYEETDKTAFPDYWQQKELRLPLNYDFQPGTHQDGITVTVPLTVLPQVEDRGFDWLVPGMLEDLCAATIRSLPKDKRRLLAPAPDVAREVARLLRDPDGYNSNSPKLGVDEATPGITDSTPSPGTGKAWSTSPDNPTEVDPHSLEASLQRLAQWGASSGKVTGTAKVEPAKKRSASKPIPARLPEDFFGQFAWAIAQLKGIELSPEEGKYAAEHLPPHLQIRFRVVDGKGKVLAEGPSLTALQRKLSRTADRAINTVVKTAVKDAVLAAKSTNSTRPASPNSPTSPTLPTQQAANDQWHQENVTEFPEHLPRLVESRGSNSVVVRGYPALVDCCTSGHAGSIRVDLQLRGHADEAQRDHRLGVARLLSRDLQLATGRVTSRWSGREALLLAASPYPSTAELVADAQFAAALALVDRLDTEIRSRAAYDKLRAQARDLFEEEIYQILQTTVKTLEAASEVQTSLAGNASDSVKYVRRAAQHDLHRFLYPGFLAGTPRTSLDHLPRYLRASAIRLERAAKGIPALVQDEKKEENLDRVVAAWEAAVEAAKQRPYSTSVSASLDKVKWLIEELRVSLFAEQLGTTQKVSVQRVLRQIESVR